MRKSVIFLLFVIALIVIISPGIIGRLAEQSMDENLDWAAAESREIAITSLGFDRGWFTSHGQHRIEIRSGELRDSLMLLAYENGFDELPVLIIDTRIDHGLVPVTSIGRQQGSLAPGLGNAVSTLSFEFATIGKDRPDDGAEGTQVSFRGPVLQHARSFGSQIEACLGSFENGHHITGSHVK